jgi:hypothetical protein
MKIRPRFVHLPRAISPLSSPLAVLFGLVLVLLSQTGHITPFTGTWKMNLVKSHFNPGPPFKSFAITFTADGTRHLDLIGAVLFKTT